MVSRFTTTSSCPFPVLSSLAVVYDEEVKKKKRFTSTRNTYILLALKSILHSFTTETQVDISYVFWTAILTTVQPVLSHTLVASSRTPTLAAVYTSHKRTIFYPAALRTCASICSMYMYSQKSDENNKSWAGRGKRNEENRRQLR